MLRALDKHKLGDAVKVEVVRHGRRTVVPVQLTELPPTNRRRGYGE
jgi:S1-C subfamily serine protease